jgi:DNA-binding ferritin-like protein
MEQLLNALKIAFASEYAFALKAQNFHWNTEGPDFLEYHMLFEKSMTKSMEVLMTLQRTFVRVAGTLQLA